MDAFAPKHLIVYCQPVDDSKAGFSHPHYSPTDILRYIYLANKILKDFFVKMKNENTPLLSPVDLDKHHFGLTAQYPDFSPFYNIFHINRLETYRDKILFPLSSQRGFSQHAVISTIDLPRNPDADYSLN